jgi:protein NrfC
MDSSRRNLLISAGAVIFTTGVSQSAFGKKALVGTLEDGDKRYGMVFDETACIGCTACTDACRTVNNVPEGQSRLEIVRSEPIGEYPNISYQFSRVSCQHCDNAPCVHVCPTGAAFTDPTTGIVDVTSDKCVGCGYCLAACPYQVRFFHEETKSADKCNFCRDTNLKAGKLPACVESCPTKALVFGDLNDPNSQINKVISNNTVYRDKVTLGTEPKLYKIPDTKGEIQG